jgi:hypothetical protein
MEPYLQYQQRAVQNIKVADHMLTMTYPLIKDPKLLLSVLQNLFMAASNAMACILYYERHFNRIPAFQDTFESKYSMFQQKIVQEYQIDLKWVKFIAELKELVQSHKESTTEFPRSGKFVMADHDYRIKTLGEEDLKYFLKLTKDFVDYTLQLVNTHDAMPRRR